MDSLYRLTGRVIGMFIFSFVAAVVLGSIAWFIGRVFGADWVYWTYIRGWFIIVLVLDFLANIYRFGAKGY